jgi:hypothetical protein
MRNKQPNFSYYIFYLLFLPDTWRILIGIGLSYFIAPLIMPLDLGAFGSGMFYVMLASIGYSIAGAPARRITQMLKKFILEGKSSSR